MKTALVSANFGGVDAILPMPRNPALDTFYYTDTEPDARPASTWTRIIEPNYPREDLKPILRAKYFKCQIHRLAEIKDYEWLVWADSCYRFTDTRFLTAQVNALSKKATDQQLALIPHPARKTVLQEYEYCRAGLLRGEKYLMDRYATEKMTEQIAYFAARGHDLNAKLWGLGLWITPNTPRYHALLNDWWDQQLRFSIQDQLPLPFLLKEHGIEPTTLLSVSRYYKSEHFERMAHVGKPPTEAHRPVALVMEKKPMPVITIPLT